MIQPGTIWRHFKGNLYAVLCIAIDTETGEEMVIYHRLNDPDEKEWCRSKKMFLEELDKEKYPDAQQVYRFEQV